MGIFKSSFGIVEDYFRGIKRDHLASCLEYLFPLIIVIPVSHKTFHCASHLHLGISHRLLLVDVDKIGLFFIHIGVDLAVNELIARLELHYVDLVDLAEMLEYCFLIYLGKVE